MIALTHSFWPRQALLLAAIVLSARTRAAFPGDSNVSTRANLGGRILYRAELFTNADGFEAFGVRPATPQSTGYFHSVSLEVRPEWTVKAEVCGLTMLLSATTNRFYGATIPDLTLTVVNLGTSSGPYLHWMSGQKPLFGELSVSNVLTGQLLQARTDIPHDLVSVSGGNLASWNRRQFQMPLSTFMGPQDRGAYAVRFKGKLSSPQTPGADVPFVTPPLFITID